MSTDLEDAVVSLVAGATHTAGVYTFTCDTGSCEITIKDGEVSATGTVTPAYSEAAQKTIDDGKMAAMAEMKGRADGLFNALTDDPQRGREIAGSFTGISISRGPSGGATVTYGPFGGRAGWEAGEAPPSVADWASHTLERKTERYVVYTNIEAAKRKAWGDAYSTTGGGSDGTEDKVPPLLQQADGTAIDGLTFPEVTEENGLPEGTINLDAAAMTHAARAGLLDPADFPPPGKANSGTVTYTYNGGDEDDEKAIEFTGTFHGASGTYVCTDAATTPCTVSVTAPTSNNAPVYEAAAGTWQFRPDAKNSPEIVEQDSNHMHFGWWINTPTKAGVGGEFLYDAEVFYGGSMPFATTAINALTGEVTYEGSAAGLYAVKELKDDDGEIEVAAAHGEFTATVSLTANFGTGSVPGNVKGTIEDFVRDDSVSNDWSLMLDETTIGTAGGSIISGNDKIGDWAYGLYGSSAKDARPSGIAGHFDAAFKSNDADTAVAGGFATTQK